MYTAILLTLWQMSHSESLLCAADISFMPALTAFFFFLNDHIVSRLYLVTVETHPFYPLVHYYTALLLTSNCLAVYSS